MPPGSPPLAVNDGTDSEPDEHDDTAALTCVFCAAPLPAAAGAGESSASVCASCGARHARLAAQARERASAATRVAGEAIVPAPASAPARAAAAAGDSDSDQQEESDASSHTEDVNARDSASDTEPVCDADAEDDAQAAADATAAGVLDKVAALRNRLADVLTLRCPACQLAWHDFDGCFALQCHSAACRVFFCGWCLAGFGGDDSACHAHVTRCDEAPAAARGLFRGSITQFSAVHRARHARRAAELVEEAAVGDVLLLDALLEGVAGVLEAHGIALVAPEFDGSPIDIVLAPLPPEETQAQAVDDEERDENRAAPGPGGGPRGGGCAAAALGGLAGQAVRHPLRDIENEPFPPRRRVAAADELAAAAAVAGAVVDVEPPRAPEAADADAAVTPRAAARYAFARAAAARLAASTNAPARSPLQHMR